MIEMGPDENAVLDALADGVILARDGRIVYGNPAAARLLAAPLPDLVSGLTPSLLARLVEEASAAGRATGVFERGSPPQWIEAVARPLVEPATGAVLVLRDVTERRQLEAVRRDFVADASHELKTPVASIQAAAETLVRALDDDPDAARRFARQVYATASRLSHMVEDLLDLSRLETEQPELEDVNLARLVAKEADRIADRAEVGGVDLVVQAAEVLVRANRKDVRLAVRNLLENAVAYTPLGGTVTVSTGVGNESGEVTVNDTGVGIPRRDLPRIFERFYRVDDARNRDTGGTGLGLAIVRHVADQHGGTVLVESELGQGSTFRIRLPLAPS